MSTRVLLFCFVAGVVFAVEKLSNEIEVQPYRLSKGGNSEQKIDNYKTFLRMLQGSPGIPIAKLEPGMNIKEIIDRIRNWPVDEGKACHMDVEIKKRVIGKCTSLGGVPNCISEHRREVNYGDCFVPINSETFQSIA